MKKNSHSILLLSVLSLFITACAKNPVTGDQDFVTVTESQEISQGKEYHQTILQQYGVYDDPELQTYVNNLGQELARISHRKHLKFHFTVLDSPQINAFALPGGYVYVTRGIMAYLNSEAELIGVLGHEIGHVTARHSVRQQSGQLASNLFNAVIMAATGSSAMGELSQQLSTGLVRGYGRKHELEADKLGAKYLHKAGYDPEAMLDVISVLKDQEVYEKALAKMQNREPTSYHGVFSTHPENDDRLKTVIRASRKLTAEQYKPRNRERYLGMIDGMDWGPSVKQGILKDNLFSHPGLAIELQFPKRWKVQNQPENLLAADPDSSSQFQMSVKNADNNESSSELLKRLIGDEGLRINQITGGVTASTAITVNKENRSAQVTAIKLDSLQHLILIGFCSEAEFESARIEFLTINDSFRRLSPSEVAQIGSAEIDIIKVTSTTNYRTLASQSAIDLEAESRIRLINQAYPDGTINEYPTIKTIIRND
ncbi:MAG: putative Zn-dependent protease [Gammaproteobacteria bacterium]|jgi:predicted Zn-dependent protease